ncbi:cilia- and flagella-associated protein 20-like [Cydia splendana]|uniref:cilia- and flagella-associated protein 20-like n=1 Tax=Cydia splendana TaxID=1100963 RepID=UPI00300C5FDB
MFKNTFQSGLLSIFYSCGSNPLAIWDSEVQNGHIKRLTDKEVNSIVLEIVSTNVATTYITCPKNHQVLGIKLPFLVIIVKNLKRYFSFEITVLDDNNMRRRFRISNFQSTTKIKPFCTSMPIGLSGGWNQIQFNLADFTKRAYGTQFIETLRVQVHANARLRRIYFSDRLYTEEELPQEYKLYLPLERKQKKDKKDAKEAAAPAPAAAPAAASDVAPAPVSAPAEVAPIPKAPTPEPEEPKSEAPPTPTETQPEGEAEPPAKAEAAEPEPAEGPAETPAESAPESTAGTPSEPASEPVDVTGGEESAAATPAAETPAAGTPAPED